MVLSLIGVLFLVFYFFSGIQESTVAVCPGGKFSVDLIGVVTGAPK